MVSNILSKHSHILKSDYCCLFESRRIAKAQNVYGPHDPCMVDTFVCLLRVQLCMRNELVDALNISFPDTPNLVQASTQLYAPSTNARKQTKTNALFLKKIRFFNFGGPNFVLARISSLTRPVHKTSLETKSVPTPT